MNMSPMGPLNSIAGTHLAQTKGAETDRASQESGKQTSTQKAADGAATGAVDEDKGAGDRDADGRKLWEETLPPPDQGDTTDASSGQPPTSRQSRDATGERGANLDLTG
jgi:hypothetical protein